MRKLNGYQYDAADFVINRLARGEIGAGLFMDPGLGKTLTSLHIIEVLDLLGLGGKTLIVAPLRVVHNVWPQEISKWGFDFSVSVVNGTKSQREKAIRADADIYLITPEGLPWLFLENVKPQFNLVIIDESTKLKNWTAKRTIALRKMLPSIPRRLILTGTPSPNGLQDLFAQIFVVDDGAALGKNITVFRSRFCYRQGPLNFNKWVDLPGALSSIEKAIGGLVYRLKAEDHLDLPPLIFQDIWVDLPPKLAKAYKDVERQLFADLDSGETLTASSAGAKYCLCKSIANGGAYQTDEDTGERTEVYVHDEKVKAVQELVGELGGKPVLVAYQYNHDLHRLQRKYPDALVINGQTPSADCMAIICQWNNGEIPVLFVQPQAMSHGLNLQAGGNDIIWFGLTDNLETYDQLNRRLYRQGVTGSVRVHRILAKNTIDMVIRSRIENKGNRQTSLLESLKRYQMEQKC